MGRFTSAPDARVEYYKLNEKGYAETGGGDAFDLTVAGRTSERARRRAMLALGYDLFGREPDAEWMRVELEGGRRQILSGSLGNTMASLRERRSVHADPGEAHERLARRAAVVRRRHRVALVGEVNAEEQQTRFARRPARRELRALDC